ncbi:MAG: hypothetical protein K5910_03205 [Bacteroidales bacterium]|nr:hypothetical protein [Bacteroidales bacterium]
MKMKKLLASLGAILILSAAWAQESAEDFKGRYERLVRNVGYSGVGVETLLDRWEEAYPDDAAIPTARYNYFFMKSQSTEIVPKPGQRRYLGNQPALTLKDSEGNDVNYFEEVHYDEELFGEAVKVLDRQIAEHGEELRWRYMKISALTAYEKESPDMAAAELKALIRIHTTSHPAWTLDGQPAGEDIFQQGIGEFCYNFFQIASPAAYEYFREISEQMSKLYPKNTAFINNMGSYWQVAQGNDKQATKYYKKALKIDPDDYAAKRNLQIIEKKQQNRKKK